MSSWLFLILLAAVALWLVGAYNGLVSLKNQTLNAFKQIDVQLKRRHDLIPNLVNAVKGAMDFERSTLEAVIQARNQAVQVNASGPGGVKRISQAENALSSALQRLLVVVEQYPQLKATSNVGQLQEELTSTENRIAFARQLYNDTATQYNTRQQQFPTSLVAGLARVQPADLWEITDQGERAVPQVDLSLKPRRDGRSIAQSVSATGSQSPAHKAAGGWLRAFLRVARLRWGLHLLARHGQRASRGATLRVVVRDGGDGPGRAARLVRLLDGAGKGAVGDRGRRGPRARDRPAAPARERGRGDGDRRGSAAAADLDRPRSRPERVRHRSRPPPRPRGRHPGAARPLQPGRAPAGHRSRAGTREEPRRATHDHAGGPGGRRPADARRGDPHLFQPGLGENRREWGRWRPGRQEESRAAGGGPARRVDRVLDPGADHLPAARARGEPQARVPGRRDGRAVHPQPPRARERAPEDRVGRRPHDAHQAGRRAPLHRRSARPAAHEPRRLPRRPARDAPPDGQADHDPARHGVRRLEEA